MSFLPAIISSERLLFVSLREMYCGRSSSCTGRHPWMTRATECRVRAYRENRGDVFSCLICTFFFTDHLISIYRPCFMRFIKLSRTRQPAYSGVFRRRLTPIDFTYCPLVQSTDWPIRNERSFRNTYHRISLHMTFIAAGDAHALCGDSWKSYDTRVSWFRGMKNEKKNSHSHSLSRIWIRFLSSSLVLHATGYRTKPRLS